MQQLKNKFFFSKTLGLAIILALFSACKEDLPEVGSIADLTPPTANFTYAQLTPSNYLEVTFSNTSTSSTDYLWDFGDGSSSTALEPVHVYAAEGTYKVTLTSKDKLGVESVSELEFELVEPVGFVPPILEAGFEDGQLTGNTGDGRDSWRNSALGGVIQITSSPVVGGTQAAKLSGSPSDKRIGYQLLTVTANTVYDVSFYYTMYNDQQGSLTVSVLDGPVTSHAEALTSTIGTTTVSNQSDPDTYVKETFSFNSGGNTEVALYFFNDGSVETRLDDFSISLGQGTVPPIANFTYQEDTADYKAITFTNNSVNADIYAWNFGDGNTSTLESPTHTYAADGTYTVTLVARNAVGQMHSKTMVLEIKAPPAFTAEILEASFEDGKLAGNTGDGRDSWRNSSLGNVIQITSSPVRDGVQAAKLTGDPMDQRIGFQYFEVLPNTAYDLSFYYTMKDDQTGSLTVSVLSDSVTTHAQALGATIESVTVNDQSDPDTYIQETISFNSGTNSKVAIYFFNEGTVETRLDNFTIEEQ